MIADRIYEVSPAGFVEGFSAGLPRSRVVASFEPALDRWVT